MPKAKSFVVYGYHRSSFLSALEQSDFCRRPAHAKEASKGSKPKSVGMASICGATCRCSAPLLSFALTKVHPRPCTVIPRGPLGAGTPPPVRSGSRASWRALSFDVKRKLPICHDSLQRSGFGTVAEVGRLHRTTFGESMVRNMSDGNSSAPTVTVDNMNPCLIKMEYAVRGPLVARATAIEKELQKGVEKPFSSVIKANIGDAHAMGQQPITFLRQVLCLVTYPKLLDSDQFPEDAKGRARTILAGCKNGSVGSYSDSPGIEAIRRHVAQYIEGRDGIPSDWQNVILCAGASEGIRAVLKLIFDPQCRNPKPPGVMIPIPQYPLYSATLAEFNMNQIGYYLDEDKNWALDISELQRALDEARKVCNPRALVVINPGNPTGSVLSRTNIEDVIKFAQRERLFLLADEVYQNNVYADGCSFHSFKKVMVEMGAPYSDMELASFMSCSKGYMGECGIRGGYAELVNMDPNVKAMLLKSISAKLCPTVVGQACMDVVVNPPKKGEPSYESFTAEKEGNLTSLAERAKLVEKTFNNMEGFKCNVVQGAMYAFPRITLPEKAIQAAKKNNQAADVYYAFQLLENTGICIIPGSGFGQKPGTFHFRTTILPQKDALTSMLERMRAFHTKFIKDHS